MQRNRAEIHDVAQALQVADHEVVDVAAHVVGMDPLGPDPIRRPLRRILLKKRLPADPIRIPREHQRPILQIRQQPRRHRLVVLDQLRLGVPLLRPKHLRQIRNRHPPLVVRPPLAPLTRYAHAPPIRTRAFYGK